MIITVRIPILRSWSKRWRMPSLTTSLRWTTPSTSGWAPPVSATTSGVPPPVATPSTTPSSPSGTLPPCSVTHRLTESVGALADREAVQVHPAHAGLGGEGHQGGVADVAFPDVEPLLGQHHDGATFRRLVGQAGQLGRCGEALLGDAGQREELRGLAVAERDGAGLVQEQRRAVARRLDRPARHGEHVVLHQAVHAGDADRRQQGADGRRDEADQQGDQDDDLLLGVGVDGERLQGHHGQQEDDRQAGQQDVECDLVRRLLPLGPLDQGDHAIEERLARPWR